MPQKTERLSDEKSESLFFVGRDGEIRTRDLTHPKRARYQAAPRPVKPFQYGAKRFFVKRASNRSFLLLSHGFQLRVSLIKQIENLTKLPRDFL